MTKTTFAEIKACSDNIEMLQHLINKCRNFQSQETYNVQLKIEDKIRDTTETIPNTITFKLITLLEQRLVEETKLENLQEEISSLNNSKLSISISTEELKELNKI